MPGVVLVALLVGCQPSADDSLAKASEYLEQQDYRSAILEAKNALRADGSNIEARRVLGTAAFYEAEFSEASDAFRRVAAAGDATLDDWITYGRTLLAEGSVESFFDLVYEHLSGSESADALSLAGNAHAMRGQLDEALDFFARGLEIEPGHVLSRVGIARIRNLQGEAGEAQAELQETVAEHPDSFNAQWALGSFLLSRQQFDAANTALGEAVRLAGDDVPLNEQVAARVDYIISFLAAGNTADARAELNVLQKNFPFLPVYKYLSGTIAYEEGNFDFAESELQEFLQFNPDDPRVTAVLGAISLARDDLRLAENYLLRSVGSNGNDRDVRRLLAEAQLRLNKPEEAMAVLQSAQEAGDVDAIILAMLGRAAAGIGDSDAAIAYFEQSIEDQPGESTLYLALAAVYSQAGRSADALRLLENMPQSDDSELRRTALMVITLIRAGDAERATEVATAAAAAAPDDPAALALRGIAQAYGGDLPASFASLERVVEMDPDNLLALNSLARLHAAEGNAERALHYSGALLDHYPAFLPVLQLHGSLLAEVGRPGDIDQRIAAARTDQPESAALSEFEIRMALRSGDTAAALALAEKADNQFPDDGRFALLRGMAERALGRDRDAIRNLRRAVQAQGGDAPAAVYMLADALVSAERFEEAGPEIARFRSLRPDDVAGPSLQVRAMIGQGNHSGARTVVEEFAGRNPGAQGLTELRAQIELSSGNPERARALLLRVPADARTRQSVMLLTQANTALGVDNGAAALEEWVAANPDDLDARLVLAGLKHQDQESDNARAAYEAVLERQPNNLVALNNLAWLRLDEDPAGALELAERAHAVNPDNMNARDTLGWALFRNGRARDALPHLNAAAENGSPEVRYHLAAALSALEQSAEARQILEALEESGAEFDSRDDAMTLLAQLRDQ